MQRASEIVRNAKAHTHIAGFAIDAPLPTISYFGNGVEIDGWVVGRSAPVTSVVATVNGNAEVYAPLDVQRPDVSADYPGFPSASRSGFSFWLQMPEQANDWTIDLDAEFPDGDRVPFALLNGHQFDKERVPGSASHPVASPDYIVLGTQRGGTTSLFRYLSAHPNVRNPATKELHYLTDRFHRGASWYLGQFPDLLRPGEITGEATPYALFHPLAPARAKEMAPHARFIVLLRDPVERARSHYQHERALNVETLSFSDAIAAEPSRLEGESQRLESDPEYVSFNHKHFSYLARGNYAAQLSLWLKHFPRDHFLILKSEDLYRDPGPAMKQVLDFLELEAIDLGPFDVHNQSAEIAWDATMRAKLGQQFAPGNTELSELVNWPVDWP